MRMMIYYHKAKPLVDTWLIIHRHCKAIIIRGLLGVFDLQVNVKSKGEKIAVTISCDVCTYFNL